MVARKLSAKRHAVSGIITALIFVLGLSLGVIYEDAKLAQNEEKLKNQEIDLSSIQLQYFYLNELFQEDNSCPVLTTALTDSTEKLGESLEKIESAIKENTNNVEENKRIQRTYLQDNLRYWMLSKNIKDKCNRNIVNILYFYSEECDICPNQGVILSYFKKKYLEDILIFPINTNIEEDMIELIKAQYNVTAYPSIVINGITYTGVIEKEELGEIICSEFGNQTVCEE